MIWLIGDTHLGHENIIEYAHRTFASVTEMDEAILDGIRSAPIHSCDEFYVLGDFALGGADFARRMVALMPRQAVLIRGNHDGTPTHCRSMGWAAVLESAVVKWGGNRFLLRHIPVSPGEVKALDAYPGWVSWDYCLHAHTHGGAARLFMPSGRRNIELSVEVTGYRPVTIEYVLRKMIK